MMLFSRNKLSNFLQAKVFKNRNHDLFHYAIKIGFAPAQARRMLITGNNIRINRLATGSKVTAHTIYAAAKGERHNPDGQAILSVALDIPINELFPENGDVVNG